MKERKGLNVSLTKSLGRNTLLLSFFIFILVVLSLYQADYLRAAGTDCPDISPLACDQVKLIPPQSFDFDGTDGGLTDMIGASMGFTMVDPPRKPHESIPANPSPDPSAPGYWPDRLEITGGNLVISTTSGIFTGSADTQMNALGIGLDLGRPATLETTVIDIPTATLGFPQAGLWFGASGIGPSGLGGTGSAEDNYIKLVVVSVTSGNPPAPVWRVQAAMEEGGVEVFSTRDPIDPALPAHLWLELNPALRTVAARYCQGAGCDVDTSVLLATFTDVPSDWFSADQAGIDLNVGTRSMGGILASNRNAAGPMYFTFSDFNYFTGVSEVPLASNDGVDFRSWRFEPVSKPTAMAWGPDDRLYVADVTGLVYAFTLDHTNQTVLQQATYTAVQNRLALGLTIDPDSTPSNVILYVAHSDLEQASGDANSGTISQLTGPNFSTRVDVITGLPRAIANHATNSIHFGPDGRLYIAQGGNTGAGASNDGGSEFGQRPEQPLSAALLVADIKAPGFDGSCASEIDPDGSQMDSTGISARDVPCDVEVYASGLRNTYDFDFHSNGELYGPENGLGVIGTFPDLAPSDLTWNPANGCEGMIQGASEINDHFPGEWPDLLQRLVDGAYYGHPNPSRDECIFFGGNPTAGPDFPIQSSSAFTTTFFMDTDKYEVGRQPLGDWTQGILTLGLNRSANGIIEYESNGGAFCGRLDGELLITYFSQDDQVRRLRLSGDGMSVISDSTLFRTSATAGGRDLSNPLPITQDDDGRLYVGEFGTNGVAVFEPINVGLWTTDGFANMPVALLDAGSTAFNNILYAVAGKINAGHQRTLYAYDYDANMWSQLKDLPAEYPAVENPAVATYNGKLYAFGGSTAAFSGAVNKAAVYDPATDDWSILADMPTARGGAVAQAIGNQIYVVGGMNSSGDSVATVEIFNAGTNSWSSVPDMATARDNPGMAAIGGKLYVFGGRTRTSSSTVDPTLSSVEIFEPGVGWSVGTPMPTGRRTMNVVVVNGEAIVMGGEKTDVGGSFIANEGYDPATNSWRLLTNMPTGRHGAVAGLVDDVVIVAGGGPTGGTSYTDDVDAFHFGCAVGLGQHLYLPAILK